MRWDLSVGVVFVVACMVSTQANGQAPKTPQEPVAGSNQTAPYTGSTCLAPVDRHFADEVWTKVGERICLTCHKPGGDAEESRFLLRDPKRSEGPAVLADLRANRNAFVQMAKLEAEGHQSRLLLKATGKLKHGGKVQVLPDSAEYRILAEFVRSINAPVQQTTPLVDDQKHPPFFNGIVMLDDQRLLRRVTLSLVGRLPTETERSALAKNGSKALPAILDAIMKEDAFYARLREGFEDIFLVLGLEETDNSGIPLSYEHFGETRHWASNKDLVKHITDEKQRQEAQRKIITDCGKAIREEPLRLIEYIVRNDRPFTEIVTADYILVSPYSARCYGIFEQIRSQFKNPEDPFEYIPVKLKALVSRNPLGKQESPTGFYPHAGLLSTFQYLRRYPTTETNRNRLRARMFYQHFLGVDVLELAARVTDAAEVSAKYPNPTMQAAECTVCHKVIDPVAGLFQDYWTFGKGYGRRKGGWFTDMFAPGFEGEDLPTEDRWRALQWLGERTAKDPRFAVAMVEHAYYLLTGRKVLLPPKDINEPLYMARRRAYLAQRKEIDAIAKRFTASQFNFRNVIKDWIVSEFYRADGLATADLTVERRAELEDVGLVRMLTPEQLERKVAAIFGEPWGRLNGNLALLYGGIDSREVTERVTEPSGVMGAIQRILSNDLACKHTALDFSRPSTERRLFPHVEPDVLPGASPEADSKIRKTIVHLHWLILGRSDRADSREVDRTFQLFSGIVTEAAQRKDLNPNELDACCQGLNGRVADPHYTIRAWRGVLTYLLRQHDFLYE